MLSFKTTYLIIDRGGGDWVFMKRIPPFLIWVESRRTES
jgi:hypothetical protein